MSSGSPVMSPRVKLANERAAVAAVPFASSTFSASAGSTGTLRSRASSRKLVGEVDIIGGERGIDLARDNRGIQGARDRVVGERDRILAGGEQELGLEGARRNGERGDRQGDGQAERHCDPRSGHELLLLRPAINVAARGYAGKRAGGGKMRPLRHWADLRPATKATKNRVPTAD